MSGNLSLLCWLHLFSGWNDYKNSSISDEGYLHHLTTTVFLVLGAPERTAELHESLMSGQRAPDACHSAVLHFVGPEEVSGRPSVWPVVQWVDSSCPSCVPHAF